MNGKEYNELATQHLLQKDYENARRYYLLASEQGEYLAMYNLACMYYFGDGVERDEAAAFSWYQKAGQHGDPEALNRVGVMLENGIGVEKNPAEAFAAYRKSAELGSLSGLANTGFAYLEGKGVQTDWEAGLRYLELASERGNGIASLALGDSYRNGQWGLSPEAVRARGYYERGMQQKYAPAIERLAELYDAGEGVERDPIKAAELRRLAENTTEES